MVYYKDKERLKADIEERKELIRKIVSFANTIVWDRGTLISQNDPAHTIKRLEISGGFSFCVSQNGGVNTIQAWSHPTIDSSGVPGHPILSILYQTDSDIDSDNFKVLDIDKPGLFKLEDIMNRKDGLVAQIKQNEQSEKDQQKQRTLQLKGDKELAELVAVAERLKIEV